jgi:hypothetical protein
MKFTYEKINVSFSGILDNMGILSVVERKISRYFPDDLSPRGILERLTFSLI